MAASLLGAVDTGAFLVRRPQLFREAPSRAWGSAAFLGAWLALAASASRDSDRASKATLSLAGVLGVGNAAMLAAHVRARVITPRVFVGAGLSGMALTGALLHR
ncbi:MAG: hypothetical protein NVSMB29_03970 [Candidatus Dormibacteria bacterium]